MTAAPNSMRPARGESFIAFGSWWFSSIASFFPAPIRARLDRPRQFHTLRWDGAALASETAPDEKIQLDAGLLVPSAQALVRHLRLPRTALPHLRDIARFELERQTPFTEDQVYFDVVPGNAPGHSNNEVPVTLAVIPKRLLDPAIEAASRVTHRLVCVDVIEDSLPLGVNLLPPERRFRESTRWRNWNAMLIITCVIATIGLLVALLHARERGITAMEKQVATLQLQASDLRRREAALARANQLTAASPTSPKAWEVLAALSAALPADSYLMHIELQKGVLAARGQTEELGGMLKSLQQSALWADPDLTGSRTLPDGKRQEFSLRLKLKGALP